MTFNWVKDFPDKYSNYVCSLQKTTYSYTRKAKMTITTESLHNIEPAEEKLYGTPQADSPTQHIYSVFLGPEEDSEQWNAHACVTWIMEDKSNPEVPNFDHNKNIKFNAGFALYDSPTSVAPTVTSDTEDDYLEFTLVEQ